MGKTAEEEHAFGKPVKRSDSGAESHCRDTPSDLVFSAGRTTGWEVTAADQVKPLPARGSEMPGLWVTVDSGSLDAPPPAPTPQWT